MTEPAHVPLVRARPHPLLRPLFRAPALLYRLGLGRLLGRRFLLLEHRGRTTGRLRRTPLEVVRWDAGRREATVSLCVGRARRLVSQHPRRVAAAVRIAGERWRTPSHRVLTPDETLALPERYRREHRLAARAIAFAFGWPFAASAPEFETWARGVTAVAFTPRRESSPPAPLPLRERGARL